ncbi:MAG TPA: DUF2231 domain-containing protein [Ignavibacteria bacterium]|nr:DUF2231 domain-containing protein [Ignavibacteria bacterium]
MPNSAHLHLLTNHFPVIGLIIIFLVLLYGVFRKNNEIIRLSMVLTVIIALITILTYTSGEKAEQLIEGQEGVNEEMIEEHEEAAEFAFIAMEVLGGLAIVGLFLFRGAESKRWIIGLIYMLLMLGVLGIMVQTAHLGGQIKHSEINENK